jgi:hypothetical protein
MKTMRCQTCGGIVNQVVTGINGERVYQCGSNLTTLGKDGSKVGHLVSCGMVYMDNKPLDETVSYM